MGFIENNLSTNERIIYKGRLHWFAFMGGISLLFVIWLVAVGICLYKNIEWWIPTLITACSHLWLYLYLIGDEEYGVLHHQPSVDRQERNP